MGRFITRDTELDQHPYLYCEHDPVGFVDPDAHFLVALVLGAVASAKAIEWGVGAWSEWNDWRTGKDTYDDMNWMMENWHPKTDRAWEYYDDMRGGGLRNGYLHDGAGELATVTTRAFDFPYDKIWRW